MIEIIDGDLTQVKFGSLLHGTNSFGVMGSGVARAIRTKYPIAYESYVNLVSTLGYYGVRNANPNLLGMLQVVPINYNLYVLNGFTQEYYGRVEGHKYASVAAIDKVLAQAFNFCKLQNISLNTVKIGCNLGGLSFENDVEPIFRKFEMLYPDVDVNIFDYKG